jgi:cold shock CspA family protein
MIRACANRKLMDSNEATHFRCPLSLFDGRRAGDEFKPNFIRNATNVQPARRIYSFNKIGDYRVSEIYTGVVKSVLQDRGFCFLSPPQGGSKDIFCHFRQFESERKDNAQSQGTRPVFTTAQEHGGVYRPKDHERK